MPKSPGHENAKKPYDSEQAWNPYFITGFTDAEGCFHISIRKSDSGLGRIKSNSKQTWVNFVVTKSGDITNKIIPFFNQYQIQGVKSIDFADFCKAAKLIQHKTHLTSSGLKEINRLKSQMNTKREHKLPSLHSDTLDEGKSSLFKIQGENSPKGCRDKKEPNVRSTLVHKRNNKKVLDSDSKFNEWLAGVIDGDGCLLVSKAGYTSIEITMALGDEHALQQIKQKLGGSVKLRSGSNSIRYRLHNKAGMLDLIKRINGNIRHSTRVKQLKAVCQILNIPFIEPSPLSYYNGWFAGFFDADGTITFSFQNHYPQMSISVTNKNEGDVIFFQNILGGYIYYDKSQNGYYKWSIQGKSDILNLLNYFKLYPSRSHKRLRLFLVPQFFEYVELRYYSKAVDSLQYKAWAKLVEKWQIRG